MFARQGPFYPCAFATGWRRILLGDFTMFGPISLPLTGSFALFDRLFN
jgi:hypothetical protein